MVDMDSLKHVLTGGGAFLLLFSVLGQVCFSGLCANNYWENSYYTLFPGKFAVYYQLSIGIAVMGVLSFVCFLVYLVFTILELSVLPDMIVNITGLVGVVFWFGMFIAECCAINWEGTSTIVQNRKAMANDETMKYIVEHPDDCEFLEPDKYDQKYGFPDFGHVITVNKDFDKYESYDEYMDFRIPSPGGGSYPIRIESPCIKTRADEKIMCMGSWSKSKLQSMYDKIVKNIDKENEKEGEKRKKLEEHKITYKQYKDSEGQEMNNFLYAIIGSTDLDNTGVGFLYKQFTSIFFGGQIVGIILFVASIALGFIGGGSPRKNETGANKTEEV